MSLGGGRERVTPRLGVLAQGTAASISNTRFHQQHPLGAGGDSGCMGQMSLSVTACWQRGSAYSWEHSVEGEDGPGAMSPGFWSLLCQEPVAWLLSPSPSPGFGFFTFESCEWG